MAATPPPSRTAWHSMSVEKVAEELNVAPARGLSAAEAAQRLAQNGPNRLAEAKKDPPWKRFLAQYRDLMQIILVAAAAVCVLLIRDYRTAFLLAGLTLFNAVMGMRQEAKAEESIAALGKSLKMIARVRRDGAVAEIPAEELVAGDVVLFEAGNRVPADGRLFLAATLEIEEAALTGESTPSLKETAPVAQADAPLGDRVNMAYMNCNVTRGRGEMVVTGTGMKTEIGHIAGMLNATTTEKTPLQKQLDRLTAVIAMLAGVALILVVVMGLLRGETFDSLFVVGVTLAVAAIPTGLPAVVTSMLSLGTVGLAKLGAIVKRLPSVETLGSTSAICSDKTGTLTLNKMTARELVLAGGRYSVTGEGYSTEGQIRYPGGKQVDLEPVLLPMALCTDARLTRVNDSAELIGDPTEGALIVLAEKGGMDVEETRRAHPRVAELPFDSDYKMMATFHNLEDADGKPVVRAFVKGAPDVILGRAAAGIDKEGRARAMPADVRARVEAENERMAALGLRVLTLAQQDFDPAAFDPQADLLGLLDQLVLVAMVGIVDPPRAEARAAIAECHSAGIHVRMITGDHAVTAGAIGRELGIEGRAITGADFAAMADDEAKRALEQIGVIARVAPEDKVRLVRLLQEQGNVVAMTGDGVNDAPALKKADIGVAMGITGTEVSKEAAVMILTDDNFATIVKAVHFGRGIYDNLMKYVRFQMSTLVAFILLFVLAGAFNVAAGVPFTPIQILWINFAIDVPLAIALSYGGAARDLMQRKPRPVSAPPLTAREWTLLSIWGAIMTAGTLAVWWWAEPRHGAAVAGSMMLATFSLYHVANALGSHSVAQSAFDREVLSRNVALLTLLTLAFAFLGSEMELLNRLLGTVGLTFDQWFVCIVAALVLLVVDEARKFFVRRRQPAAPAPSAPLPLTPTVPAGD